MALTQVPKTVRDTIVIANDQLTTTWYVSNLHKIIADYLNPDSESIFTRTFTILTNNLHPQKSVAEKRNSWYNSSNKPNWWPSSVPFASPNGKGENTRLSGTQLVNIAEEVLNGNPDDIQCRGETTSELKGMQMIHINVRNIILYCSQRAT